MRERYMFDAKRVRDACVAWIRQFFEENGEGCNAVVGISGGKDSSVVAALCVEALGKERVLGVLMPCGEQHDIDMAYKLVKHLGIRHYEVNIKEMDTLSGNKFDASNPDVMTVENKKGSYSGSFTSGYMCSIYGSSVPSGWLAPMPYLNIGRRLSNLAHVRLIVPHSEGQSTAASYVYPCFYDITFERGR